MGDPGWIHADLLSTVLTSDKASRLEQSLVLDKQIATDVAAYVLPTESTGMLLMQATAKEGVSIEQVEQAIDEEITHIARDGITDDELDRARTRAEVDYAHQLENYDGRADLIGMLATYFGDAGLVDRWLDPYARTTTADLVECARQYLTAENRVTSLFVPEAA
jgi:predicted Zn-dependent peptidase